MVTTHHGIREIHQVGDDTPEWRVGPEAAPALSAFGIGRAGISDAGKGYGFSKRASPLGHVIACVSGSGEVLVAGAWVRLGPGRAYLAPPGMAHGFRTIGTRRWGICWASYVPPTSASAKASAQEAFALLTAATVVEADAEPLRAAVHGLWQEAVGPGEPSILTQWSALVHAQAMRIATAAAGDGSRLWPLWREVENDLARPWALADLAASVGVGEERLRRLCQRHLGRSPLRQVALLRMRRAAALLSSTGSTVEDVARSVGYENPFAFSVAFKRIMGRTPSSLRADP